MSETKSSTLHSSAGYIRSVKTLLFYLIGIFGVCYAAPAQSQPDITPEPNATWAPTGSRRPPLEPGTYFLMKRVAARTPTGVIGFPAGSEVSFVREEDDGEHVRVKANNIEVTVSRFDITKNRALAGRYAAPEQKRNLNRQREKQRILGTQIPMIRARHIVLRSVEIQNASVQQVVNYLNEQAREGDPGGRGVTINLDLAESQTAASDSMPPITLSLRDVTLLQALSAAAQQAHLAVRSEPYGLVVYRPSGADNHTVVFYKRSWFTREVGYGVAFSFFLVAAFLVISAFRLSHQPK